MKLLSSAILLAYSPYSLASLLGSSNDKCMWGPTYWCTSITEAKECGASRFCLQKQWNAPVGEDNQMCKLCKQVIDSVIEQVESNEDNIKPIFEQLCNYCSTPDKCINAIEQHWEDIKDMINNELSSDVICSAMNMCQQVDEKFVEGQFTLAQGFVGPLLTPSKMFSNFEEDDSDTHVRFTPEKVENRKSASSCSKTCQDCVNWAVDAKAIMKSPKRMDQMMKTIHLLCEEIPMSSLCRLVLNKKVILKIIDQVKVDEVCANTDICTSTDSPVIHDSTDLVPCDDCHNLVNDIKVISENDAKHFEFIIRQSCDLIPHPVNDMCKQMASQFAKEATNSLEQVNVDEACHDIGYCGDDSEFSDVPQVLELSTDYCDYCQTAVQYIEYAIDSDMTSDQIKVGLKKLCEKLGEQSMVQTCDQFVDKYYDTIVADIDNYLDDPESFCKSLHLCPRSKSSITAEKITGPVPSECTFGPAYWCKSKENMIKCQVPEDYCKKQQEQQLLGSTDCTFGPSFWCANEKNAKDCGAIEYCQRTTWKNDKPEN